MLRLKKAAGIAAILAATLALAAPRAAIAGDGPTQEEMRKELDALKARIKTLEEALVGARQEESKSEGTNSEKGEEKSEEPIGEPPVPLKERVAILDEEVERLGYAQRTGIKVLRGLEGIKLGGSATTFGQWIGGHSEDGFGGSGDRSSASFSGDLALDVPLGVYGRTFARVLVGQGRGVADALPPGFSGPNADLEKHGDGASVVELWYQTELPYPTVTDKRFDVVLGKMDPRRFFDANAVANDQRRQFLADTFVNNIAIDWGGDKNGYGLGARLGWRFTSIYNQNLTVKGQVGVYEVGDESDEHTSGKGPFVMAELDVSRRAFGLSGNYRFLAWTNRAHHTDFEALADEGTRENWGWGVSLDQQLSGSFSLFARYGWQDPRVNRFDQVITVGGQLVGNGWSRGGDFLGLALGWAHASPSYARVSETLDGLLVSGGETFVEAYYSYFLDIGVRLGPHVQYIHRAGGVDTAKDRFLYALRAQYSF